MRGIQYAAASRFQHCRLWNTGSPAFAGDDEWASIQLRFHAALGGGARHQLVVPALDIGKILQLHLVARVAPGPAKDGEVRNRQIACDERVGSETLVQD